ncbi:hypothetical protein [Streptomyces megasporus]|uniref:hypothetical protein n=1 Tax=Streptomyces megasporus TaxID=44060 RepID=UPI0012FE9AEF|nr:hypothetical protein [Streptomyces megasporus]
MGRVVQWACGLMAAGAFTCVVLVALIVTPDTLANLWKAGQFAPFLIAAVLLGSVSLVMALRRGRTESTWAGAVVVCTGMAIVVGVGLLISAHARDVEVQEVHLGPDEVSESSLPADTPKLPPVDSHVQPPSAG